MEPREPDFGVLHFIGDGKPVRWDELVELWYRVKNYEVLETIIDLSIREHMPIWAAEESFKKLWLAYRQTKWV